jgi:hypothetical protein
MRLEALGESQRLTEKHPQMIQYQVNLAIAFNNLGTVYQNMKRYREGEKAFREAICVVTSSIRAEQRP